MDCQFRILQSSWHVVGESGWVVVFAASGIVTVAGQAYFLIV